MSARTNILTGTTAGPWAVTTSTGDIHSQALNSRNWICQGPNIGAPAAPPIAEREANARLLAIAPDLAKEVARLRYILDGIEVYASDTLAGPSGAPDDRKWHRDGVREMRNRARAALAENPNILTEGASHER